MGSCDMKEAAPRIKLAPLNGAAPSKRGPGRPPKGSKPKRGPKAIDLAEIERELRQTGDAFLNELFPHGRPAGFEIDLRSAKWRFGPVRPSVGRFNLWCHVRKVTPKEAARQIQEWLGILGQNEPESTPPGAKEKAAAKYAPKVFDLTDAELQFRDAADKRGLKLPLKLESDGKLHRCGTDDDEHGGNGAYILHLDGVPAGGFQNWKDGEPWENWRANLGRTLTDAERKAYAERTERNRIAAEAEKVRRAKEAAKKAADIWSSAPAAPADHPYLAKKGIGAHGLRVHSDGRLIMPLQDEAGALHNLQFIAPDGEKRPVPGGRIKGCFHVLGKIEPEGEILIGEGFATMASCHEATGKPAVIALNCGNLHPVAEALRKMYPNARFIFCADHDAWTKGNPGERKASETIAAFGGLLAVPRFAGLRTIGQTDFNDLAQAEGPEAVRRCIEAATENNAVGTAGEQSAPAPSLPLGFRYTKNGSIEYLRGQNQTTGEDEYGWLCSPLEILAETRDGDEKSWGLLIRVKTPDGLWHTQAIPRSMFSAQSEDFISLLSDLGLKFVPIGGIKTQLKTLLALSSPKARVRSVPHVGWYGTRGFVLPDAVFGGEQEDRVLFQPPQPVAHAYRTGGTLDGWKKEVAALALGNSRLTFSTSCAFAGPLLQLLGMEGGGFRFWRGKSSIGKTVGLEKCRPVHGVAVA